MMDNFEKNIKENKALFDTHKADKSKLWANIEAGLDTPKSKSKVIKLWDRSAFKIAASIIIALGLFSLANVFYNTEMVEQTQIANQELNDIDAHYKGLVAYQVKLVQKSSNLSLIQKKEFLSFMDELDEEYEVLKQEFNKNIDSELILEAIVANYKKRIELIENLLKQINNSKNTEQTDVYTL